MITRRALTRNVSFSISRFCWFFFYGHTALNILKTGPTRNRTKNICSRKESRFPVKGHPKNLFDPNIVQLCMLKQGTRQEKYTTFLLITCVMHWCSAASLACLADRSSRFCLSISSVRNSETGNRRISAFHRNQKIRLPEKT